MKLSEAVKPISYLKAHASEVIREISKKNKTIIITQNGEAKAVLQDIKHYEQMQESLALLKILSQSSIGLKKGKTRSLKKAFESIRKKVKDEI